MLRPLTCARPDARQDKQNAGGRWRKSRHRPPGGARAAHLYLLLLANGLALSKMEIQVILSFVLWIPFHLVNHHLVDVSRK